MDALSTLLDQLRKDGLTLGNLVGFLHVLIGRTITRRDSGEVVSRGLSWRALAGWLKKVRWDPDAVQELGLKPDELPPRDRLRYWYAAIAHAKVDSPAAQKAGDVLAGHLSKLGYDVR